MRVVCGIPPVRHGSVRRLADTVRFAGAAYVRGRLAGSPEQKRAYGRWLADQMVGMGPFYVKIAQACSSREDVFDKLVLEGLSGVRDSLPPFDPADAGVDLSDYVLEREPIGCASVAMAVRGTDRQGRAVVLKLRRPGIRERFDEDMEHLLTVAGWCRRLGWKGADDVAAVLEQVKPYLLSETEFVAEARNLIEFGEVFKHDPTVRVPQVYRAGCNYIVMQHMHGAKLTDHAALDAAGHDRAKLASLLMTKLGEQVLKHGVVHGDLHSGEPCLRTVRAPVACEKLPRHATARPRLPQATCWWRPTARSSCWTSAW